MKIKKKDTIKILIPSDYFEDSKEYWIETAQWNNYQKNVWNFLFIKDSITQKDIETQNLQIDTEKLAKKDYYFLAISILDTNLFTGWKNLSIDEKVELLISIDMQNTDLFLFILQETKKVVGIDL